MKVAVPSFATFDVNFKPILRSGDLTICQGRHGSRGAARSVLAAIADPDHPAPSCLERLRHEYALKDTLEAAWAARPLQLLEEEGRPLLLLEHPGGEFLDGLLGEPMAAGLFLRLAAGVTKALANVHQKGLIHRDIKPSHILVDRESGTAWLTGFGVASSLKRERQAPEAPETLAGTLAYMAPEQTGRMNRSIDARSDLYAVGVTFYQMLTGVLPFQATDAMGWVHCHIARKAVLPIERIKTIPACLSTIVMKLLAKNAEERYQTAAGLEKDLERCRSEWEAEGHISEFALGREDMPDQLLIPEKLYGRVEETKALLAAFDHAVQSGVPRLVLISGYSGIGKSAVVNELHKALVPHRALFASGKFDRHNGEIPYSTLAQAFERLVHPLLGKSEGELEDWRQALQEALGLNGQLMIDLVPALKHIIGEQPPVPELGPQQAKARFQLVLRRFTGVFAQPGHPLALFLDDLQWLDAATLDFIEDLLAQKDMRHLFLIGAYRDNEAGPAHPLLRKLDAIREAGGLVQEITLAPLSLDHVVQLIADALRCGVKQAEPLAWLVHEKTAGNPFFVLQFLSTLAEEGLIGLDHHKGRWSWDLNRIRAKGYTDNVADLMAGKLTRLPARTQRCLQQLACLGSLADTVTLCRILGTPEEEVHADLRDALLQELVQKLGGSYRFVHDKVQEAAYALIPVELRPEAHLRIGRLLLAQTSPEKQEEAVFEIVSHLNRGAALITSPQEREELARLNLAAGERAKASAAHASALPFLAAGAALLLGDCWDRQHGLAFSLEINRAECEMLTSELTAAEKRMAALASRARGTVERANVASLRSELYMFLDHHTRAAEVALDYLRHCGIHWEPHPSEGEARREYECARQTLGDRPAEDLIDLPSMNDSRLQATLNVLVRLVLAAVFTDKNLFCLAVCRAVQLSIKHGNSDASCFAYVAFGTVAGPFFGDYEAGSRSGQAGYEFVQRHGLQRRFGLITALVYGHLVLPWTRHVRAGRHPARRAFEAANQIGDLATAAMNSSMLVTNLLAAGDPLVEVQHEAETVLAFALKIRFGVVSERLITQLALIRSLRGQTREFGCLDDGHFNESEFERRLSGRPDFLIKECLYWVRKLQARFFSADYAEAIDASEKAKPLLWTCATYFEAVEYHFYSALARAAAFDSASTGEREGHLEALVVHHAQLEVWAKNCPENFENRAALVAAEMARMEGRLADAERLYEQAIQSACANGFVHNEALAQELTARFFFAKGLQRTGLAHLRDARDCYELWGADGKVKQLDRRYPQLAVLRTRLTPSGSSPALPQLDISTVAKASQAVSGEIELPKLIETLMTIALENAGADRGLLILREGSDFWVEAEARATGAGAGVKLRRTAIKEAHCPEALINTVIRTQRSIILDDTSRPGADFHDVHLRQGPRRSVFCIPLIRQGKLGGVLYLENTETTYAFTPARVAILELLAAQAAISLEKARLYGEVKEREAQIRRLVDSNIIGIAIFTLDGKINEANEAFLNLIGYSREDLRSGRIDYTGMTPPEWQAATRLATEQLKKDGTFKPYEKEYTRKDGSRVPALVGGALFEGSEHEGVTFVLDLTESKIAEKRQQTMVEELNHRVKNTLATVLAISAQTFRTAESPNAFCEAFEGRLLALSQTHNLLNRSCWTGVSLSDILKQELAPYSSGDSGRFQLDGIDIQLSPVAAVTLGIAFHELATNAAKYGALSVPGGRVRVTWRGGEPGRLELEWEERDGPAVQLPKRRGFGSRLIEQMLPGEVKGEVRLHFQPQGVRCTMGIAVGRVSEH